MHRARVRVPESVAQVLKHDPCLISLAVEGFYDTDVDSMKFAAKMEWFLEKGKEEELVCVSVKMSRAM
ncbi:Ecd family [Sesbania bispinosa]|nr:Ecd family [Sesbania bispinosa]